MSYTIGRKGQVVIAKEIRERLGIRPGWVAIQRLVDDHVEIYFLPPKHSRSLKGSLAPHLRRHPEEDWEQMRETAWQQAIREKDNAAEPEIGLPQWTTSSNSSVGKTSVSTI